MTSTKKILIIEDEKSLQKALSEEGEHEGFSCKIASDGEEGLRLALDEKPDLIILDLLLPKKDGLTMLKELRSDSWGAEARVLILTNLSADNSDRVKAAVETYPEYYLVKSDWSIADIFKKVKEMLGA